MFLLINCLKLFYSEAHKNLFQVFNKFQTVYQGQIYKIINKTFLRIHKTFLGIFTNPQSLLLLLLKYFINM